MPSRADNPGHQSHQLLAQRTKYRLHLCRRCAGFVIVQERVVGNAVAIADRLSFFALQRDDFLQPGEELGEAFFLARLDPGLLPERRHSREFLDEPLGQSRQSAVAAARLANVGRLRSICPKITSVLFDGVEQLPHAGRGGPLVRQAGQQAKLIGAMFGPTGRQIGLFVPAQNAGARAQQGRLAQGCQQFVVECLCGRHRPQ